MDNFLTEGPIPQALRKIALPITVGFFFHTMFNVTDTFFAGKISTEALAGLSVSFPLFFVVISLGAGFSGGITALVGIELGKKDKFAAAYVHLQGLILLAILSALLALFGGFILQPGLDLIGTEGEFRRHALDYTSLIYYLCFTLMIPQGINSALTALGQTVFYRNFLIGCFFLNALLDPVLMLGLFGFPALGTSGAALSTSLVNFLGIFYLYTKLKKTGFWSCLRWRHCIPDFKVFLKIKYQGIPAFLNLFLITVFFFLINLFLNQYGVDAVAAFGVGLRIEQIALIPCIAINIATVSIVAQNFGAGNYKRIREAYGYAVKLTLMIILPLSAMVYFGKIQLMGLFSNDVQVIELGAFYLIFASVFTIANGLLNVNHAVLQGLKKPHLAMVNGLIRHLFLPLILMYQVTYVLKLSLTWMWVSMLAISWTGFCVSWLMCRRVLKNTEKALAKPISTSG